MIPVVGLSRTAALARTSGSRARAEDRERNSMGTPIDFAKS